MRAFKLANRFRIDERWMTENISNSNIARGMFRISIVAATLIAIAGAFASHFGTLAEQGRARESQREDARLWTVLRCGSQFLGKDMAAFTNEFGLIDIGRAGCSDSRFLANFDEIRDAMKRPAPAEQELNYWGTYLRESILWLAILLAAFCAINILGVILVAARKVGRWLVAGFR
jgi:hypothetical protein